MRTTISRRRCLCCAGVAVLAGAAGGVSAAPRAPYCRFSIRDGWSNLPPQAYTILRVAGPDDPSGVPQVTGRILQSLSFAAEFEIRISEGQENASTAIENGRRVMMVDVGFLLNVNHRAATRWGAIQVLAHEVGHHLGYDDDPLQNELQADYWSGRALRLLGSAKHSASASILAIGTDNDTMTHPNKFARARAIERGWEDA